MNKIGRSGKKWVYSSYAKMGLVDLVPDLLAGKQAHPPHGRAGKNSEL